MVCRPWTQGPDPFLGDVGEGRREVAAEYVLRWGLVVGSNRGANRAASERPAGLFMRREQQIC